MIMKTISKIIKIVFRTIITIKIHIITTITITMMMTIIIKITITITITITPIIFNFNSEMAQEWCVAYGVLDDDEAIKVDKIICTRKGTKPSQLAKKSSSSASASSSSSSSATSSSSSSTAVVKEKVKKEPTNKKFKYADDLIVDTGK